MENKSIVKINGHNYFQTIIDEITFRLLNKYISEDDYLIVNLISNETDSFSCYRSNSELGMWRLCSRTGNGTHGHLYKGSGSYDYVQTTLIHIQLQIFINNYIDQIHDEEITGKMYANCTLKKTEYKRIIDDPSRNVRIEPFFNFHQELLCGQHLEPNESFKTKLEKFSKTIPEYFNVTSFLNLSNYSYTFEESIQVTGKICQITLNGPQGPFVLYFLICKLCKIEGQYEGFIDRVCDINFHTMPIALLPYETKINTLGLYTQYILVVHIFVNYLIIITMINVMKKKNEMVSVL